MTENVCHEKEGTIICTDGNNWICQRKIDPRSGRMVTEEYSEADVYTTWIPFPYMPIFDNFMEEVKED